MSKNYFQLLGQPLENPEIQQLIAQYQLEDSLKEIDWVFKDHEGKVLSDQNLQALFIDTDGTCSIALSRKPKHTNPLTVDSMMFSDCFCGELPCGLTKETNYETINCGIKISFEKNPYGGFGKDFLVDGCQDSKHIVSLYFDEEKQFKSVTLSMLDPHTALLIKFKQNLSTQKPNINSNFSVKSLNLPSPIIAWRKRMLGDGVEAGDQIFTEENLSASQIVLDDFLAEVQTAAAKKSPTQLLAAVKNVIKSLNKLSKKMGNFIETSEREELVPYIENVVKAAGLQIPHDLDITLEWRDW